jgi:diguanylate cyclase (GGDEF)-like protein
MRGPTNVQLRRLYIGSLPSLIAEFRASAVLGIIIIALLWVGVALKYRQDVKSDFDDATRTNDNFARVFEENVSRSIGEIDKAILYLRKTIANQPGAVDYNKIVETTDVLSDIIVQVAIIDGDGMMRASNVGPRPSPVIDLSDREHFRVHKERNEDKLFISKPVLGRSSGRWSVQVTRRFLNKQHEFGGVVVASLNPDHFTKFYNEMNFGPLVSISLIGGDFIVRSSGGKVEGYALGQDVSNTPTAKYMGTGETSTFVDESGAATRLVTLRKVKDQPLYVTVSVNNSDIYADSQATLKLNALAAAILTILVLFGLELLVRVEARARQKSNQLATTLEHIYQGILVIGADGKIPLVNRRCVEFFGLPETSLSEVSDYRELLRLPASNADVKHILAHENVPPESGGVEVSEHTLRDNRIIECRTGALPDNSVVQTLTDITQRRQAELAVQRMASEDPLTGLPNRRIFQSALEKARADAAGRSYSVMYLDLDRFKVVNDTLGHSVGDDLLQQVASRLRGAVTASHVLARLGGDEFAVVIPEPVSKEQLELYALNLNLALSEAPFMIGTTEHRAAASIGIAVAPQDGSNADELLMAADLALYQVKAEGRGGYKFYRPEMRRELESRREMELELRKAIEAEELDIHYQPLVDAQSKRVVGLEALARWTRGEYGAVPPATFIQLAEDTRLILPLGEWVLYRACRDAASWPEQLKVAVNLSPVQFSDLNLCKIIQCALAVSGLSPERLELEITERIFMEHTEQTIGTLKELKRLGVHIAMDDFGTGYSSLSYLRSFPFDRIKIDRSFISGLGKGAEQTAIVQAVISIAKALGMSTTAEGVETDSQREFLVAIGCNELQGYLFSPPVPLQKALKLVTNLNAADLAA